MDGGRRRRLGTLHEGGELDESSLATDTLEAAEKRKFFANADAGADASIDYKRLADETQVRGSTSNPAQTPLPARAKVAAYVRASLRTRTPTSLFTRSPKAQTKERDKRQMKGENERCHGTDSFPFL